LFCFFFVFVFVFVFFVLKNIEVGGGRDKIGGVRGGGGGGGKKQLLQQISMSVFRNLIYRRGHAVVHLEGREFNSRLHNPFGCTMALSSTQPLTEMSTRHIS